MFWADNAVIKLMFAEYGSILPLSDKLEDVQVKTRLVCYFGEDRQDVEDLNKHK